MANFFFFFCDLIGTAAVERANSLIKAYSTHGVDGFDKGLAARAEIEAGNERLPQVICRFYDMLSQTERFKIQRNNVLGMLREQVFT